MLIKAGVDISRLNREIRRALRKVSDLYMENNQEVVVTSTFEGNHGAGSLHYANDAFDVGIPEEPSFIPISLIIDHLGVDYDVVRESDHIHVEYDPK